MLLSAKTIRKALHGLNGRVHIPGDKSVSHRSVMFSALGSTPVHITNFLHADDCLSTVGIMKALGARIDKISDTELVVTGNGLHGLQEPAVVLDAGNSGTTLRLMMGLLSPQPFYAVFTGDTSLSKRPMGRVANPLRMMGARIEGRNDGKLLPISVLAPDHELHGIDYDMPVASAQVKSAILLAGLYASGKTSVTGPYPSRDHTERMLSAFGADVTTDGNTVTIKPASELVAPSAIDDPGYISSAANWIVAASIIPGSDVILENTGINHTRTGILDVMRDMGADISLDNIRTSGGEEIADIRVRSAKLHGTKFGGALIPRLVDEIPIIATAALFADGVTEVSDAGELRVKETDRLHAIATELGKFAPGSITESEDGIVIRGGMDIVHAECDAMDDHRMAMSEAIAAAAGDGAEIDRSDSVRISYPDFYQILESTTMD